MKVLLIQPPIQDFYDTEIRLQPLGLAYLKAITKKFHPGIELVIKDYHTGYPKKTIPYPREMNYLKKFYIGRDKGPFSSFDQYYHFGADFDFIVKDIEKIAPDLIGISSLFSPYYEEILTLTQKIKSWKNVPILIGGPHATVWPDLMLSDASIDYVIRGEGEKAFVQFLQEFQENKHFEKVQNLSFKSNKKIIHNSIQENMSLEEIPFPEFDDFPLPTYQINQSPLAFILSSRGCPYRCDFCSTNSQFNYRFHPRAIESILEEMSLRYKQGYRAFDFEDDNLTYNKKRSMEFFKLLNERFPNKDIRLYAMNGVSYLHLDKDILISMKQAGFEDLNLSLVSSSKELNQITQRPFDLDKFTKVVRFGKEIGFNITAYQIIGHPEDNLENMIKTLLTLSTLPVLIGSSIFYLIKGTDIEKKYPITNQTEIKLGRLTSIYQKNYPFSQSDIFTLFISTRIINFIKSGLFQEETTSLSSLLRNNHKDPRIKIGMEQLREIISGDGYFIQNKKGKRKVDPFNHELFKTILRSLPRILTQDNRVVINDV